MKRQLFVLACVGAMSAYANADLLVDNGSQPTGSGRTVSGDAVASGWTVFQKFTITDTAWHITSVGVDGWTVVDPLGLGMTGRIVGTDEFGNPNDKDVYAVGSYHLADDPFSSNWQYDEYDVTLNAGTYWFMSSDSGDPNYWSAIFLGTSGEGSVSQRHSDGQFFAAGATALRIEGTIVPVPGAFAALGGLALAARRRRRGWGRGRPDRRLTQ